MKKKLCLILALFFVLSAALTACGGETDAQGGVISAQDATEAIPGGAVEQPDPSEAPTEPENDLSLGRMEGGVYTNEYVGYACSLDSNWSFLSAEELQQLPGAVNEALSGSELSELLANTQQFTDMMAENVSDLTSMNVLYQKLSMQERLAYSLLSEEEIVDATLEQKDMLISSYAQAGIIVSSMKKETVTFMGEERIAIRTTAVMNVESEAGVQEIPYFILQFFDARLGEYSVTTTLASYLVDNTDSLMDLFYKLEP